MIAPAAVSTHAAVESRAPMLAQISGFFLAFRICMTFLWFQSSPQLGTVISVTCTLALLSAVLFCGIGDADFRIRPLLSAPTIHWILAFLALSFCSLFWTQAKSSAVAAAYWVDMTAEVFLVILLVGRREREENVIALMQGYILGACVVALVAWTAPSLPDLRLGNEEFMHPNGIGLQFAVASLCAQFLSFRARRWKWLSIALAITLLRTISKTSIAAYLAAEGCYLLQDSEMRRRTKLVILASAAAVCACFFTLFQAYFEMYASNGDQAETLTGRTWIWATSLSMAVERPFFGSGIYSFRAIIPPFGIFEPWHAHNELLQQFFEYGLVGLVVLLGIYWSFYRTARRAPAGRLKILSFSLLVFALIHGFADTVSFGLSYPLWLLTALAVLLALPATSRGIA